MYDLGMREEELKNRVAADIFPEYDCARIVGNIDFCVSVPCSDRQTGDPWERESLLWAEAKKGRRANLLESFVQLILTIGRARTFDKVLPPAFLGAFDAEKIAFIPYNAVLDIFYQNDFNWNVTPSDHDAKEFRQVMETVETSIRETECVFRFGADEKELRAFVRKNFIIGRKSVSRLRITKNNFASVYLKWLEVVKPTIGVNWDAAKKSGIIDADFYLADLLSEHNITLREKLYVLLRDNRYELERKIDASGFFVSSSATFDDDQKAHKEFWNRYNRPPKREYWDYIVNRRDLLVPQDIRERKGSFFTPRGCVEKAHEALERILGEDWQDEYVVWDCAAGTGNLLAGLTNKYNIWASTIDQADVDVMRDRIQNGANLLESHVFRFDFLNDSFDDLPDGLRNIVTDPEKRKKLVILINPPYAEATSATTVTGTGANKSKVATENKIYVKYKGMEKISKASNELFAQFLIRIDQEIGGCILANFSKLKNLQGQNFKQFRQIFQPKLENLFLFPADIFDNVKGKFPIGFFIWNTGVREPFREIEAEVYNRKLDFIGRKIITCSGGASINQWIMTYTEKITDNKGTLFYRGNDFQNQKYIYIGTGISIAHDSKFFFNNQNIIVGCIYFSVRLVIEATWLNDRDQFLYPNDGWETDTEFQGDCLAFTLFHGQNRIRAEHGVNHWIPFTEDEVNARDNFASHFMTDYITGKIRAERHYHPDLDGKDTKDGKGRDDGAMEFSAEASAVFDAGRELWRYYHSQPDAIVNASYYDIREYFQGRRDNGTMNTGSADEHYNELNAELRSALKKLGAKIAHKVYEYGFLLR